MCLCCFGKGHRVDSPCPVKSTCGIDSCKKSHHRLLQKSFSPKKNESVEAPSELVGHVSYDAHKVLLRVLPVMLSGPTGREEESRKVTLQVASTKDGSRSYTMKNVRTIEELSLPIHRINMEKLREDWPHLHDVAFDSIQGERPMILIGQDNILLTVANKIVRGPWVAPVATKTLLGWVVHGNIPVGKSQSSSNIMVHFCDDDEYLTRLVKESFSTENFDVKVVKKTLRSKQDQRAVEMMERTTRRMGNQFETGLLWRDDNLILPESKTAAIQRLNCIEKRMDRDPEFAETYAGKLEDFLEKGYAREITDEEDAVVHPRVWYVPHFSVTNPNKPGKIRLVFDAASKSRG
ncbi:unnamed protein product, partial [Allacma fusca]